MQETGFDSWAWMAPEGGIPGSGWTLEEGFLGLDDPWRRGSWVWMTPGEGIPGSGLPLGKGFLGLDDPWRRDRSPAPSFLGFPCSSVGEEAPCNAGGWVRFLDLDDPWGRDSWVWMTPGEGTGHLLQHSRASLVAHLPPEMWKTWGWSLGWEDHLEKGRATHSSILA